MFLVTYVLVFVKDIFNISLLKTFNVKENINYLFMNIIIN